MSRNERAHEAIQRAEDLGLRLQFDTGLMVVEQGAETIDQVARNNIIAGLGGSEGTPTHPSSAGCLLPYVRDLLKRRAMAARAKERYLGQKVWTPDLGWGTLADADGTVGHLIVEFKTRSGLNQISVSPKNALLVIAEEKKPAPPLAHAEQKPQRKGILALLRRNSAGSNETFGGGEQ